MLINLFPTFTGVIGELPGVSQEDNGLSFYRWDISNKYYNASIHFCKIISKPVVDEDFSENVNAFILYFNSLEVCYN